MPTILILLCLVGVSFAQTRVVGEVTGKAAGSLTLRDDNGQAVNVPVATDTRVLLVPPGETNPSNARAITLNEIRTGDRVIARDNQLFVTPRSDLQLNRGTERDEWRERGISGRIAGLTSDSFTVATSAGLILSIATSPTTVFRRYAPESVRFSDAKPGTFSDLKVGDGARVLGERSGQTIAAASVVSGTFRSFAGTIAAVDRTTGDLTITDLDSKKPVTVKISSDSTIRFLPQQTAETLAHLRNPAGGENAGIRSAPPTAASRPQDGPDLAAVSGGTGADLARLLPGLPGSSPATLKPGDAVIVVSTAGVDGTRVTAVQVLAGVEPLLTGPASDRRLSGEWNLDFDLAP